MRSPPLALAALVACGPALPPPPPPGSAVRPPVLVRVATWNVHDLFDAEDRLVPPGDADLVPSPAEVAAKLARVAAVLARVDADAWLLEEVESRAVLEALADASGYPAARLVDGNDPRGIDVALLTRLPVAAYASHAAEVGADGRLLWPRDCVEAWLDAGGRRVVLVGSHLSSGVSDDGTRRRAQAARMREIADAAAAEDAAALVLAGGDLNDAPDGEALAPLLADGAWRDPVGTAAVTWIGGAAAARLDYLLVPAASGALAAAHVDAGADVAEASDHRPVVLDLRLP
ncbi:MAG TPA: endonuclease/exonuclease/phosphatase family protein [Anaeromyxobacter sp.]|nr:endonuclease/exonuclease/phosphatase family protein [Anaeromyxobacter sp.]